MKVVAYVPMKLNNERLPNKNTKLFSNGKPLLAYILETLSETDNVDEVYAYCSDESITEFLPENVQYLTRSKELDLSSTKINEVMTSFARDVDADIYVLAHATAPFITKRSIELGVDKVKNHGYDSALSVLKLQDFFWKDNLPFNYDVKAIPRTQDLDPMFQETTGLYIYKKSLIVEENRRIGDNPYLIEVSKIEAVDINEPIDFIIADALIEAI